VLHSPFIAESFIGADGKRKKKIRRGNDEIVESDFEYEIVSYPQLY